MNRILTIAITALDLRAQRFSTGWCAMPVWLPSAVPDSGNRSLLARVQSA